MASMGKYLPDRQVAWVFLFYLQENPPKSSSVDRPQIYPSRYLLGIVSINLLTSLP